MATLDHRHLPPYLTDRLLARVLPAEVAEAVTRQEESCDDCRERLIQARRAEAAYLTRHPPERRVRELLRVKGEHHRRRRLVLAWGLPMVSAAALAAVARSVLTRAGTPPVSPERSEEGPRSTTREAPSLGFSVRRADIPGASRPGRSGETLRAGDVVELHLDAGPFRGAHVFVVDTSGEGQPLLDWSPSGGGGAPTLVLDDSPGPQRIVVLFHDLPDPAIELPPLREAIARTHAGSTAQLEAVVNLVPPDGRQIVTRSILIRKETPPPAPAAFDATIAPD
jgi:hypothetical protein